MTMDRISKRTDLIPSGELATPVGDGAKAVPKENCCDLKDLRDSLETKRQLILLLEKGGYVKDMATVRADVDRAIADLDEIIGAFSDI